jgi:ATP/maltotriose-dependent transcriptional regulator MalT
VAFLLPFLAWAHLDLGEIAVAEGLVEEALRRARADRNGVALAEALPVAALVAIRQMQWTKATRALEEGLELTRRIPYLYGEARLLHLYGEMQAQQGEGEAARARLVAAEEIFKTLGARKDAERVALAIASLPASEYPGPAAGF